MYDTLYSIAAALGMTSDAFIYYAKLAPFAVILIALLGFTYSNFRRAKDDERAAIARKLHLAGSTTGRGMSAAEIAKRIAPNKEEQGGRKILITIFEWLLKLAKFDRKGTEKKLIQSGDRDPRAISKYIIQRGAGMAIAPALGWIAFPYLGITGAVQVIACLVCVLAGGIVVDTRLDKALKLRREKIASELPVLLDLLTIYLESGQAFDVALSRAAVALRVSFPTAAAEVMFLRQDLELSVDRQKTFRDFAERVGGPSANTFVSIVIQSEKRGNQIAPSLRSLAKDARKDVVNNIEKKAQKLPTLMQGPMFILILPAIFLSVIGPAIIQMLEQFGG